MNATCTLSVIPLRKEHSDKSEMVSQLLFGETMTVLDEKDKWLMVKCDADQYEGWLDRKQVRIGNFPTMNSSTVNTLLAFVRDEHHQVMIIPGGSLLGNLDENQFELAGKNYTLKTDLANSSDTKMEDYASMFLNTPYLWGGRTFMGIDCSGFTQLIARLVQIPLPRDAAQQADAGTAINFIEESLTGDLAFFDNAEGRITHVGIILNDGDTGKKKIIHASGKVRLDVLDHQGIYNKDLNAYSHNLRIIKRIQ